MHDPTELRKEVGLYLRAAENASDPQLKQQMVVRALGLWEQVDALSRAADDGSPETTVPEVIQAASCTSALPVARRVLWKELHTEESGPVGGSAWLLRPQIRRSSRRPPPSPY
jgi:hypothetical protein